MKNFSDNQRDHILDTLKENKNDVEKTATQLGITPGQVRHIDIIENKRFNFTEDGQGRPELKPFIVAIRGRDDAKGWDNSLPKVKQAKELYDEGKVEMCQGMDGMNLILYAIPRKTIDTNRRPYFANELTE